MSLAWLPNLLSGLRLLAALPLFRLIEQQQLEAALLLFALAGLSDGLDGWLARRYHWQSRLGGLLDPLADKLLMLSTFTGLTLLGWLPPWLLALIVGRDLVIVGGAVLWHIRRGPFQAEPLLLSRINTALQIVLAASVMLHHSLIRLPDLLFTLLIWVTSTTTALSGLAYVLLWSRKPALNKPP